MSLSSALRAVKGTLDAINNKNNEFFIANFAKDAIVIDEGMTHDGIGAISKWSSFALIEHNASVVNKQAKTHGESIIVPVIMDGDFAADYGITEPFDLYFDFILQDGLVKRLTITPWDPSTTKTMTAVLARKGNLEDPLSSLLITQRPEPIAPKGWVKIKMTAASLNFHDIFSLRGLSESSTFPLTLGCEGTGTLEDGAPVAIYPGMGDANFKGDETLDPARHVFSEQVPGTLASYIIAPERNVIPLPKSLDPIDASVLGIAWLTAYRMLFTKSGVRAGQTMLVQGSSGGVTTALIQLGSAAGMRVWCTGRTEEKRALGLSLGAEKSFPALSEIPEKADAVFDTSGEVTFAHSIASVKTGGTVVTCGGHAGMSVALDVGYIFVQQISIKGVYLGTLEEFRNLIALVGAKGIKPMIGEVLPLDKVEEGLKKMLEGKTKGKIVVTM